MILVTGATGFLGSYLVRYLIQRGHPVKALRRESSDISLLGDCTEKAEWAVGDVLDISSLEAAFEGVTKVYHTAAIVSFDSKKRSKMMKVNIEGTANVVNLALERGIEKLVHVSSVSALGKIPNQGLIDENAEWESTKFNTNYGLSKFLGEKEVWRGIAEGLNAVIVNPSLVIGAGRWSDSSVRIFETVANGLSFYTKGSNGYVDVRDVVKCMMGLMDSNLRGERFIINAENLSYREVTSEIAEQFGMKKPGIPVDGALVYFARVFDFLKSKFIGIPPIFTREVAQITGNKYNYGNDKIRKALDFEFTSIRQTIEQSVKKFKESQTEKRPYAILDL